MERETETTKETETGKVSASVSEVLHCSDAGTWRTWLDVHHTTSKGVWLRFAKKNATLTSLSYAEALDEALCYGWIDGQTKRYDADSWLQRFTPRARRSLWSKVNREKVARLVEAGLMQPHGLAEVERARKDGRWDAAYDPASRAQVPQDFQAALDAHPSARDFYATLNSQNRYAMIFRLQTAKQAATRARRIAQFIALLEKGEKLHP